MFRDNINQVSHGLVFIVGLEQINAPDVLKVDNKELKTTSTYCYIQHIDLFLFLTSKNYLHCVSKNCLKRLQL